MTLIEVLLALAIAVLVIALVFSLYHTVSATRQGQADRRRGADAAADAVRRIAHELECAFSPEADEACAFLLEKDVPAKEMSKLSLCAAVMPENETDLRWFTLCRVGYRLDAGERDEMRLVRETRPLSGPGAYLPPVTNALADDVESFRVSVFDGSEWKDAWAESFCPRAARIRLTARCGDGERTFETEVLIPAGNPVTSSVVRIVR